MLRLYRQKCAKITLSFSRITLGSASFLLVLTILSGLVLSSTYVSADESVVDDISITVPVSCTMSGTGQNSHNAEIANGTYQADIGTTTLHAFCNDNNGFAIYAAGYTGDEIGGTNSNKLVGTSASSNAVIETGLATTAGNLDVSNWAMKLAMTQDSGDTTGTNAFTIDNGFNSYHIVPNEYVKVAHKNSYTDMTATTGGVKLTTTYAAYISKTQPADIYSGQVKYTLVHPSSAVAGRLNVTYDSNGLTFANNKTTNLVTYDATMAVTKKSYFGSYHSDGSFSGNSRPAGNNVVTIDGADVIHIRVTYGAPQNDGGPPSDLAIWAGNHPDYTDANINSALTSCGGVNAVNGAFSSDGNIDTQVTMECDITGDSVTFYDFSTNTNNTFSMGYYAVVTSASKAVISGTYQTPIVESGRGAFLGWSANPNTNAVAEEPLYVDGTDFIINAPYTNEDAQVTLYAVWGKTFNAAYTDAGKAQLNNHYKMQDATDAICREVYVGATETLIDLRDNTTYMVGRLKDGKCWMLDNLALDPTDSATAARMNASNTNATQAAIDNLLHGGSSITGWSSVAVVNSTVFQDSDDGFMQPRINNDSKNTLVTSYGPASSNGQAKVGIYYNFCAASASTYCYANDSGVDVPDTIIDVPQDICPASWRMPTGGSTGEYYALAQKYGNLATKTNSFQYNLSTPLSGYYNSSPENRNSLGYLWSSTYSNSMNNYFLGTSPSSVDSVSIPRIYGLSMRCLVSE